MVIITGLGRCGTSILAKYLKEVGFGLGQVVHWHDEARAGMELSTFYSITDWLYCKYLKEGKPINIDGKMPGNYWTGTYREALNEVDKDERQGKVEVVKDPRITWHPDIIESIYEARSDIKLLICHRDIEAIYNSRNHSLPERYNDPKPRKLLSEYQIDFANFYTRVLKLGIPYRMMFFPNFLKNFEEMHNTLSDFLPHDFDKGKEVWNKIIDWGLIDGRT